MAAAYRPFRFAPLVSRCLLHFICKLLLKSGRSKKKKNNPLKAILWVSNSRASITSFPAKSYMKRELAERFKAISLSLILLWNNNISSNLIFSVFLFCFCSHISLFILNCFAPASQPASQPASKKLFALPKNNTFLSINFCDFFFSRRTWSGGKRDVCFIVTFYNTSPWFVPISAPPLFRRIILF